MGMEDEVVRLLDAVSALEAERDRLRAENTELGVDVARLANEREDYWEALDAIHAECVTRKQDISQHPSSIDRAQIAESGLIAIQGLVETALSGEG